jgi:glycosyltransferase involved in cell wall biosynthesis
VTTILFIASNLGYSGVARRLAMLAINLPRGSFQVTVAVLGGASPWGKALASAGITVHELGWRLPIDARPLIKLRHIAAELRPDIVHVWGGFALASTIISGVGSSGQLVVSDVLAPLEKPGWLLRSALRRVGRVIAFGSAEALRYRNAGVVNEILVESPFATDANWPAAESVELDLLPNDGRILLGVGPIEREKGFIDAVWAFDILHFLYDDLRLILAGPGSQRQIVENFAGITGTKDRVSCPGVIGDLTALRRLATLAWVPGRAGGVQAALEAMAAGLPVVATLTPRLAEVVIDGETGYLAAPGDKADFARQTRNLLEDDARRQAFGAAARRRVYESFTPQAMASACARAYGG